MPLMRNAVSYIFYISSNNIYEIYLFYKMCMPLFSTNYPINLSTTIINISQYPISHLRTICFPLHIAYMHKHINTYILYNTWNILHTYFKYTFFFYFKSFSIRFTKHKTLFMYMLIEQISVELLYVQNSYGSFTCTQKIEK